METRLKELEGRVASLEAVIERFRLAMSNGSPQKTKVKRTRAKRNYTAEEREAIRARLVAGKEAAKARREAEAAETETETEVEIEA